MAIASTTAKAEAHLQRQIQIQRETLERRGVAPEVIEAELRAVEGNSAPAHASRRVITRGCLELPDGSYRSPKAFTEENTMQALQIVRRDIKRALHGLGPLFGEQILTQLAAEVIREDFDADGPQTEMGDLEDPEIPNFA